MNQKVRAKSHWAGASHVAPAPVLAACRIQAQSWLDKRKPNPRNLLAALIIVALWLALLWLAWRWAQPWIG